MQFLVKRVLGQGNCSRRAMFLFVKSLLPKLAKAGQCRSLTNYESTDAVSECQDSPSFFQ